MPGAGLELALGARISMRYAPIIIFCIASIACVNKKAEMPLPEEARVREEAKAETPIPVAVEEAPAAEEDKFGLKASDIAVVNAAGKELNLIKGKHEKMISLFGTALSDGPMYPENYKEFLTNPPTDISDTRYLHEFIGIYDGLFYEYYKETDDILSLEIDGPSFHTPRGITVGSSVEDVIRKYGDTKYVSKNLRKEFFNWLRAKYAYPNIIYSYGIDPFKMPEGLGGGTTIFFFIDERNMVELIKLVREPPY